MQIDPNSLSIVPLSLSNLKEAVDFLEGIFPDDLDSPEAPKFMLPASLDPGFFREQLDKADVQSLDYWIMRHDDKVIATTGLYVRLGEHEDELWLGWFGVDPQMRGSGIGRRLLEWTISRARVQGGRMLKLYTSDSENEAVAQHLYERVGLAIDHTEAKEGYTLMYRQMNLV